MSRNIHTLRAGLRTFQKASSWENMLEWTTNTKKAIAKLASDELKQLDDYYTIAIGENPNLDENQLSERVFFEVMLEVLKNEKKYIPTGTTDLNKKKLLFLYNTCKEVQNQICGETPKFEFMRTLMDTLVILLYPGLSGNEFKHAMDDIYDDRKVEIAEYEHFFTLMTIKSLLKFDHESTYAMLVEAKPQYDRKLRNTFAMCLDGQRVSRYAYVNGKREEEAILNKKKF